MSFYQLNEKIHKFKEEFSQNLERDIDNNTNILKNEKKHLLINKISIFSKFIDIYIKNIDTYFQAIETNIELKNNLIKKEATLFQEQNNLIKESDYLENLLNEVDVEMSKINKNFDLKNEEIIDFAIKINPSLIKSDISQVNDITYYPQSSEINLSALNFYDNFNNAYIQKCQNPKFEYIKNFEYETEFEENKFMVRGFTPFVMRIVSQDNSLIKYSLDDSIPSNFIGENYDNHLIEIKNSCTIRAVCYKRGFEESEVIEKSIVILDHSELFGDLRMERFMENIPSVRLQFPNETPYTARTPYTGQYSNMNTPHHLSLHNDDDDDKEGVYH